MCLLSPGGKLTKLLAFGLPAFHRQAASFWYFHSGPPANGRGFTCGRRVCNRHGFTGGTKGEAI